MGRQIARLITAAFPPEMEIKFEKVLDPFLLLHVNRYAGRRLVPLQEASCIESR